MSPKNKKIIEDYLKRNKLMTLGTAHQNRPWGVTVFFAYDPSLNIIFYSNPKTKHAGHIRKNQLVSVVINQDHGTPKFVKGLQLVGRASLVPDKDHEKYYALYRKRYPWADDFNGDHKLYLIKPTETHYIDQKRFGHFFRVHMK